MTDTRDWTARTWAETRRLASLAREGVRRTYRAATLKLELASLRRTAAEVTRDLGAAAARILRETGTLTPESVAPLLRRLDDLEAKMIALEREIANLESEPEAKPRAESDLDSTLPAARKRPALTGADAGPTD